MTATLIFIFLTFFLTVLASYCNALMDLSAEGKMRNPEHNKGKSWKSKWASPYVESDPVRPWYYLGLKKLPRPEAFPFSSTALVWRTDFWHRWQFYFLTSLSLTFVTYDAASGMTAHLFSYYGFHEWHWQVVSYIIDLLLWRAVFGITFTYFHDDKLLTNKYTRNEQ